MSEEQEVYDKDGVRINVVKENKRKILNKIRGVVPLLCLAAFLAVGFFVSDSWRYAWMIFLIIPLVEIIISAIQSERKKKIILFTILFAVLTYVGLSLYLSTLGVTYVWLKLLVIFIIIPIVSIIIE